MTVVFQTPGYIDHRSFTTFGINSKPNTSTPIGFFGTGLKYAIAGLVRLDCHVDVWIGDTRYHFRKKKVAFRDKEFDVIFMDKNRRWLRKMGQIELPYTTELGKTWQMWQFFRELEANTRDEKGKTFQVENLPPQKYQPDDWTTTSIVVYDPTRRFDSCWTDRHQIFLDQGDLEVLHQDSTLTIYNSPSEHIFFRGMRVAPFPEGCRQSPVTYNVTGWNELTEDRTLKYLFVAMSQIAESITRSSSERAIRIIFDQIERSKDKVKTFESTIPFDDVSGNPSQAFQNIMLANRARNSSYLSGSRISSYWGGYALRADRPIPRTADMPRRDLVNALLNWVTTHRSQDPRDALTSARRLILLAYDCIRPVADGSFTYDLDAVGEAAPGKENEEDILGEEVDAGASPVADSPIEKDHHVAEERSSPSLDNIEVPY